jgi:phage-related protein (TIGR01555 family)
MASVQPIKARNPIKVASNALWRWMTPTRASDKAAPFAPYAPLKGVLPKGMGMAMDSEIDTLYSFANTAVGYEAVQFLGYPYLAELAQKTEFRKMSEVIAEEMTRKWGRVLAKGDKDKSSVIDAIEDELDRLNVREQFRKCMEMDCIFGRGQMYYDFGDYHQQHVLKTPLIVSPYTIGIKTLKAIRTIDPTWTAPNNYNSSDPLHPHFMRPQSWFVMGKEVHASRVMTVVSREVPDLLKAAYNFGGVSLYQMAIPYIDNWRRTQRSVSDLLHSFTVFVLSTNLAGVLQGESGEAEMARLNMFNFARDNRGLMVIDQETEALTNISVPLGGLDALQNQALEQLSVVSSIPLVKLLGVSPGGLNASSDGEIRVFYDKIAATQRRCFGHHMENILQVVQLSLFGVVDPDIRFEFNPLWELDEAAKAAMAKVQADTDIAYLDAGVIDSNEARSVLANDDTGRYSSVDLTGAAPPGPIDPDLMEALKPDPVTGLPVQPPDTGGDGGGGGQVNVANVSLNGAQVSSMMEIATSVSQGLITYPAGLAMLTTAFPLSMTQAQAILGTGPVSSTANATLNQAASAQAGTQAAINAPPEQGGAVQPQAPAASPAQTAQAGHHASTPNTGTPTAKSIENAGKREESSMGLGDANVPPGSRTVRMPAGDPLTWYDDGGESRSDG